MIENQSALSDVAYKQLTAMFPFSCTHAYGFYSAAAVSSCLNRDSGRAEPPSFDLDTYHPLPETYHFRIYGRKVDKFGMRIELFRQDCSPASAVQLASFAPFQPNPPSITNSHSARLLEAIGHEGQQVPMRR